MGVQSQRRDAAEILMRSTQSGGEGESLNVIGGDPLTADFRITNARPRDHGFWQNVDGLS